MLALTSQKGGVMKKNTPPNQPPSLPIRLYTTTEVAILWGIGKGTIYVLVPLGKLRPITNMGRGWKWTGDELGPDGFKRL